MSEQEPILSMLKWLCEQLMEADILTNVHAQKSECTDSREAYRSGYIQGVSTRKIKKLARSFGIESIAHSQIDTMTVADLFVKSIDLQHRIHMSQLSSMKGFDLFIQLYCDV